MQKTIVAALAILASTAVASATDLPSKTKAPTAPTAAADTSQFYVGGNIGGNLNNDARVYSGGAVAGWNALPFLAVEGTYDLGRADKKVLNGYNYTNTVVLNAVPQYKIPGTNFTIYALGGVGYRWNNVSTLVDHSVYNLGGGIKYEFVKNFEIDARYRRIDALESKFRNSGTSENRATVGVNFKF